MRWTIVLALFFVSCAQVGTLDGGPQDRTAPRPIESKSTPPNQSTFFKGNQIEIPFDEFIRLNKPSENLIVIPTDIKPTATIKGKKLIIKWDDTLSPNTTYAFYLNGLVQDTREGNDSLMTFVFATGAKVDSLTTSVRVIDAFSGKPLAKVTVGLYSEFVDTLRPSYFSQTNENGFAEIKYLKSGDYSLIAFNDKNKDLKVTADEKRGFKADKIKIGPGKTDTTIIRVFESKPKSKIQSFSYLAPGAFFIGGTDSIAGSVIRLNGTTVLPEDKLFFSKDSLAIFSDLGDTNSFQLIIDAESWTDTTKLRVTKRNQTKAVTLKQLSKPFDRRIDESAFFLSSKVSSFDTTQIYLQKVGDSIHESVSLGLNGQVFNLRWTSNLAFGKYDLVFPPGSLELQNTKTLDTLKITLEKINPESLGAISVFLSANNETLALEILKQGVVVDRKIVRDSSTVVFANLPAGEYSFRAVLDANNNGLWDTGNLKSKIQPEEILYFKKSYTLRANWEMEVELVRDSEDGK